MKILKGAKETVKNYRAVKANNKQTKKNLDSLTITKAKKNYLAKTGQEMTPSRLNSDMAGMILPKATREYLKDKKVIRKDYKKKYGL